MLLRSLIRGIVPLTRGSSSRKALSTTNVGPNHELLQVLSQSKLLRYRSQRKYSTFGAGLEQEASSSNKNAYKVRAFARAIEVIGALEEPVRNVDDVKKVRTIHYRPRVQYSQLGSSAERRRRRD